MLYGMPDRISSLPNSAKALAYSSGRYSVSICASHQVRPSKRRHLSALEFPRNSHARHIGSPSNGVEFEFGPAALQFLPFSCKA